MTIYLDYVHVYWLLLLFLVKLPKYRHNSLMLCIYTFIMKFRDSNLILNNPIKPFQIIKTNAHLSILSHPIPY